MGKTKLIYEIIHKMTTINPHLNVYNLDTKKQGDFTERDGTMIVSAVAPDAFTTTGNRMVWKPLYDSRKEYDKFFHNILEAKLPAIVNIDECVNMRFGQEIPRELEILLMQGRGTGIHVIGGTQRVAKSPRELRSQATYIVSFVLRNEYDRNTMASELDLDAKKLGPNLGLRQYEFWFLNTNSEKEAKKYKSYHELLPLVH